MTGLTARIAQVLTAAAVCVAVNASALPGRAAPMRYGDPIRKELMNTVRPRVERALRTPVIFKISTANLVGSWAFMVAEPRNPNGTAINYKRTPLAREWESGAFGGLVTVLYRRQGGRWVIKRYDFGASDVTWIDWSRETGAPKSVFPRLGR